MYLYEYLYQYIYLISVISRQSLSWNYDPHFTCSCSNYFYFRPEACKGAWWARRHQDSWPSCCWSSWLRLRTELLISSARQMILQPSAVGLGKTFCLSQSLINCLSQTLTPIFSLSAEHCHVLRHAHLPAGFPQASTSEDPSCNQSFITRSLKPSLSPDSPQSPLKQKT